MSSQTVPGASADVDFHECLRTVNRIYSKFQSIIRLQIDLQAEEVHLDQQLRRQHAEMERHGASATDRGVPRWDYVKHAYLTQNKARLDMEKRLAEGKAEAEAYKRLLNDHIRILYSLADTISGSSQSRSEHSATPPATPPQDADDVYMCISDSTHDGSSDGSTTMGELRGRQADNTTQADAHPHSLAPSLRARGHEARADSADGNLETETEHPSTTPTSRSKDFSEIYFEGHAVHGIVRVPDDKNNWWLFSCHGSNSKCAAKRVFYHHTDRNLLNAVGYHVQEYHKDIDKSDWASISNRLGYKVLNCSAEDVERNNEAFNAVLERLGARNSNRSRQGQHRQRAGARMNQRTTARGREDRPIRSSSVQTRLERRKGQRGSRQRPASSRTGETATPPAMVESQSESDTAAAPQDQDANSSERLLVTVVVPQDKSTSAAVQRPGSFSPAKFAPVAPVADMSLEQPAQAQASLSVEEE